MKLSTLATGLGLCLLAPAAFAASPTFYTNIEFGTAQASGGAYTYEFQAISPSNFPAYPAAEFDSGRNRALHIGAHFSNPFFIELGVTHAELETTQPTILGAASAPCPVIGDGLAPVCSLRNEYSSKYHTSNVDLVGGWDFKLGTSSTLTPYLGARRIKFSDARVSQDALSAPFTEYVANVTRFDHIGWVAGVRYQFEFAQSWYVNAEAQQAHASGDRSRKIDYEVPGGIPVSQYHGIRPDDSVGVTDRMFRVSLGKRFILGGKKATVSLGYQDVRQGGLDTTHITQITTGTSVGPTVGAVYVPNYAALGDRNANVSMRGFFLNLGINQ
ncbi:MAG TPA: hypothetical protein VKM35_06720 [Arenimonas sp.]|uniref:hypothetical protein n=1 Tax=Arenimonas sp. TaxID=1872635 RepID=UPI002CB3916A|nr:hypothetical protein [Arenimonas sp.]HMB56886.1 hypothetical protein [Arenimonas sp.]